MKYLNKNNYGYTLLEMIVSVAIVASLASIILANFSELGRTGDVHMAAQLFSNDLRVLQGHALSIRKHENEPNTQSPSGSWGLYFNRPINDTEYYLYGDFSPENGLYDGGVEIHRVVKLPENIIINRAGFNGAWNTNRANILFVPPRPETSISRNNPALRDTVQIELLDTVSMETKVVFVNKFGLIDVQN